MPQEKIEKISDLLIKDYISINQDKTVKDAMNKWKKQVKPSKIAHVVYVVDDSKKLVGIIDLRDLLLEDSKTKIKKIMNKDIFSIQKNESIYSSARTIIEKRISEIPVVNKNNKLKGIVIAEDIFKILHWENEDDIYKLVGILEAREKVSIDLKSSLKEVWRRVPWLVISVLAGVFLAGSIIKNFENAIIAVPAVSFFIPVLMATGGNISSQTTTIFVRSLSSKDPSVMRKLKRLFISDLIVGNLMGVILGGIIALSSNLLVSGNGLNIILFLSIMLIANFSIILGFLVPFLASLTEIDPAVVSGPFVLIIQDVISLLVYFSVLNLLYF